MPTVPHHPGTPADWMALRAMAEARFRELHVAHSDWSVSDLFAHLQLPPTPFLCEMARSAGIAESELQGAKSDDAVVLDMSHRGIWSARVISEETGIPLDRVRNALSTISDGYGMDQYGSSSYGGQRAVSDGTIAVLRRVTEVGQMSYRGHLYSLGNIYRGRVARVIERGAILVTSFGDRPELRLAVRRPR